jgi:hypothetical protein
MRRQRIGTFQVAERLGADIRGSFEALVLFGMADLQVGDYGFSLVRVIVAPEGHRWQYVGSDEIYIATETGGLRSVYRLVPEQKRAYLVEQIKKPDLPPASPKKNRPSRTETYRGLRCTLEEQRVQVGSGTVSLSRQWRVVDAKASGWTMRAELQLFWEGQLSSVVFWDTLDMSFRQFPRHLFTIQRIIRYCLSVNEQ